MGVRQQTEHHLEFLSLKGGCTGLSRSIYVKMPHCWKSHVKARIIFQTDPLLCDLPKEITLEEINSQIALEYGQAMVVNVRRADNVVLRKSIEYGKCSEIPNTTFLTKSSGRYRGGSL